LPKTRKRTREKKIEDPRREDFEGAREGGTRGKNKEGSSNGRNERRKEDMSAVESALDVLSRAATMMQGQFASFGILFCDFSRQHKE